MYPQQPQYPQAPPPAQYPPQYPQAPQQFASPVQYPQQPVPEAQPAQPLAPVSIDDFYRAPAVGTPSWSWKDKPIGTTYVGIVARDLTPADVQQNTDMNGKPLFFRDGSPQPIMRVPMRVQPSPEFPNGEATWIVNVRHRDELARAMAEAGAPTGPPQGGAGIQVTLVERRPNRTGNPSNIVRVAYQPPAPVPPQATPAAAPAAPVATPAPVAAPQPAAELSPEQQQLLAKLTGQQAPAQQ